MSKEGVVWPAKAALGGDVLPVGETEGEPNRGRASDGGSCSHADQHSAEIGCFSGGWIHQG